jgi:hypothetical protein
MPAWMKGYQRKTGGHLAQRPHADDAHSEAMCGTFALLREGMTKMAKAVMTDHRSPNAQANAVSAGNFKLTREKYAEEYAVKLAESAELREDMEAYVDAKQTVKRGAVWVFNDLRAILGDEGMAGLPEPDSENTTEAPCNNPDVYRYPGKNAKGNQVMLAGSFYDDLAERLPWIVSLRQEIENVSWSQDPTTRAKAKPEYQAMSPLERLAAKQSLYDRVSNQINLLKRAAWIAIQFEAAKLCPKVSCYLLQTKDGELPKVGSPIVVRDADLVNHPDDFDTVTDVTFLKYDFAKAAAMPNGGTFEEVVSTAGREPGGDNESDIPSIEKIEQLEDYAAEFAHAVQKTTWKTQIVAMLKAHNPEHDDFILSLFTIFGELEQVLSPHGKRQDEALERVNVPAETTAA